MVPDDRLLPDLAAFWMHLGARRLRSVPLTPRPQEKVFFLGFHKTGTMFYARLFQENGYSTLHSHTWRLGMPRVCDRHEVFLHGCLADFPALSQQYPNARFVLNTRPLRSWLISRVHHMRRAYGHLRGPLRWLWNRGSYLAAGHGIESGAAAIAAWVGERRRFHRSVLEHFQGSDDKLLVLDIEDPNKCERLEAFLGTPLTVRPTGSVNAKPAENPRDRKATEVLVDGVLLELGVSDVHELV